MRIPLVKIKLQAAGRPPGYYQYVVSRGRREGEYLVLTDEVYAEIKAMFRGEVKSRTASSVCSKCNKNHEH
jgi:hypothetical protein